jgi:SAM-dependent methyltransferase
MTQTVRTTAGRPPIDETRVEAFLGQIVQEVGSAVGAALVVLGDRLGYWRTMADSEPISSAALAARTGTHERYVREWLRTQAAGGYVSYDPRTDQYTLPPEHAAVLADDTSPIFLMGAFQVATSAIRSEPAVAQRFRTGEGFGWHEHDSELYHGIERHFATVYRANLVNAWIPALDGVEAKLIQGARVADIGCGHGAALILLATAFPRSTFVGFDNHEDTVTTARARAVAAGVADRVSFEVASATDFPDRDYDLLLTLDALHDMGDPMAAAAHARQALAPHGTWLVAEPRAEDNVADNLNPFGRMSYGISTLVCTPGSLAQPGRAGLGAQAGPTRLRDTITAGGFRAVRTAAETPFTLVLEAHP